MNGRRPLVAAPHTGRTARRKTGEPMATVLVVDDDATNREFLRTLLVHRGHRVREAADGESALRMAGDEPPDAVITDVVMPGLDGYELARSLRSRPSTSRIPIAFNTAHYDQQEIEPLVRACGVQDVILKPAPAGAVLAAIDVLLDGGRAAPAPGAAPDFAHEHRHALKAKLMSTTAALQETQRVAHAGTWDLDPRGDAIMLSPELRDLLGLAAPKVFAAQLWRRVHPEDAARMQAFARHTLRTGRPHATELRIASLGGVVHQVVVSCCRTAEGTLWGVAQDVSGWRDEQLRRQLRADAGAERRVLDRLVRAALPGETHAPPGVDLATRWRPASDRLTARGDWHDVLALPGRVLVAVSNVAGHERDAAAVVGPVRAVLRAYAIEDPDPAAVLHRLNRFLLMHHGDDTYATAAVALYDPASRTLDIANAGHPAPLLLTPAGTIPIPPGPALGIAAGARVERRREIVPPGGTLLMYTAGLIDRPGDPGPHQQRLAQVAAGAHRRGRAAGPLLDDILAAMLPDSALHDDACLVALRPSDPLM
jgi:CheY-like chemotaxis protein